MIEKKDDRRRFDRLDLHADLRYQLRGQAAEPSMAVTNNVSAGGVALNVDKFIPVSTLLNIDINLMPRVLSFIGQVAWCQGLSHSDRFRIGVEFLEVDPAERDFLQDYIKMQTGEL